MPCLSFTSLNFVCIGQYGTWVWWMEHCFWGWGVRIYEPCVLKKEVGFSFNCRPLNHLWQYVSNNSPVQLLLNVFVYTFILEYVFSLYVSTFACFCSLQVKQNIITTMAAKQALVKGGCRLTDSFTRSMQWLPAGINILCWFIKTIEWSKHKYQLKLYSQYNLKCKNVSYDAFLILYLTYSIYHLTFVSEERV